MRSLLPLSPFVFIFTGPLLVSSRGSEDGRGLSQVNLMQSILSRGPLLTWSGFCQLSPSEDMSLLLTHVTVFVVAVVTVFVVVVVVVVVVSFEALE